MARYGTAPRKVNGVWQTSTGRKLSPGGQRYWERQLSLNRTDGRGHMNVSGNAVTSKGTIRKPGFSTFLKASHGDEQAQREVDSYIAKHKAQRQTKAENEERLNRRALGPAYEPAKRASKVVNPVAGEVIKSLSPTEVAKSAVHNLEKGNLPMAALDAASIFPIGRGARGVKAGVDLAKAAARRYPEGTLLHGSPEGVIPLNKLDPHYHTGMWREGQGFYLTPDPKKAAKYAEGKTARGERKTGRPGGIIGYTLRPDAKVLDVDAQPESFWRQLASEITGEPIPESLWREWASDIPEGRASAGVTNRMRLNHFLSGWGELPQTESFYAIEEALHNRGVQATLHMENGVPVYVVKDKAAVEQVGSPPPVSRLPDPPYPLAPARVTGLGLGPGGRAAKAAKDALKAEATARAAEEAAAVAPEAVTPVSKVLGAIPSAKKAQAATRELQREARAEKFAQLDPAFRQAGGGVPGHTASGERLRGELPYAHFADLTDLTPEETRHLIDLAHSAHGLTDPQKYSLEKAILRAREGRPWRNYEIRLINKAFGGDFAAEAASKPRSKLDYVTDIVGISRALMATGEFSYRLRNGLFALAMDPVGGIKNAGGGVKVTFSQRRFDDLVKALNDDPEISEAAIGFRGKNGKMERLDIHDITGHQAAGREEPFPSPLAEKIPVIGHAVKAADRNFTATANLDRAMIYKSLLELGRKKSDGYRTMLGRKKTVALDDAYKASAIKVANWATGRSHWGHDTAEALTNVFFFAPKLFKTRVDVLNPMFWMSLHPLHRRQAAFALVKLTAGVMGLLAVAAKYGLDVEIDPRSSDFAKIRHGKTRFDFLGGNQQIIRAIAMTVPTRHKGEWGQWSKSATTKKYRKFGHGEHGDPLLRLFEGKLSPPASFLLDVKRGEMFAGRPLTAKDEFREHFIPLLYQDIWDAWHMQSPAMGGVTAGLGWWGVGTQTYTSQKPDKKKPKRERVQTKRSWERSTVAHGHAKRSWEK